MMLKCMLYQNYFEKPLGFSSSNLIIMPQGWAESNGNDAMTKHEDEVTTMKVNERKDRLNGVDRLSQQDRQSHTWVKFSLAL